MQVAAFPINTSLFTSTLDLARPLWGSTLYDPYGLIDYKQMMMIMDRSNEKVGNITGVHYELDRPTTYFQAGALFTVAGAAPFTQTGPLAATLVNADGTSAVRVGDLLKLSTGLMPVFRVDSVSGANPPVVTLTPLKSGYSTAIPGGANLSYVGRTEKERSSAPGQLVRGTTAYNWYTQISRATVDLSGSAQNIELKPAITMDGRKIAGWNTIQTRDSESAALRDMFNTFLFGTETDSSQANTAVSLSTTAGLDITIQQRGWQINVGAAAVTYANLVTATQNIKAQGLPSEYYSMWLANKRNVEIDAFLGTALANSLNPATEKVFESLFFGSNVNHTALKSTFSWQSFEINGVKFAKSELNLLNNPTTFNVNSSTSMFQNLIYFIPEGQTNMTDGNGKMVKSNYVTLLNRGRYHDRWMYMKERGLMSNGANDGVDQYIVDILTNWGARWVMMNSFGRIY